MAGEEPPYLDVGTEVSAKYRGAFCEAKVKKVVKAVKCRVSLKEGGSLLVKDDDIRGPIKVGRSVEVKHPESGIFMEGTLTKVMDQSVYTVIFDDADENTLRRSQLCLKGDKHFVKSETLDDLPLTHPEHFGTPVVKGGKGYKRKRAAAAVLDGSDSEIDDTSSEDSLQQKRVYRGRIRDLIGRVLCMEIEDRKKTLWVPVLVAQPNADDTELKSREHLLVKSFKDSKFYTVSRRDARDFTREIAIKNEDKALKAACDKALSYIDSKKLPMHWDKEELLGSDSAEEDESDSSDDEPCEEKDRFVAQLYKFMDDRGTPINKAPLIANRDLNLYRLFRLVQNLGGYNKVTNQLKWRLVYTKMNLPMSTNASNQMKTAYKKYLHAFEDFYRKLGSTMGTISRPSRSRHSSGRSLLSFRERERESSAPKSPGRASKKSKESDSESDLDIEDEDMKSEPPTPDRVKTRSKLDERVKAAREETDSESEQEEKPVTRKGRMTRQMEDRKKEDSPTKPATRETAAKLAKETDEKKREKTYERKSLRKEMKEEETPSERDEEEEEKGIKRQTRKKSARLAGEGTDRADDKEDDKHDRGKRKVEKSKEESKDVSEGEETDKGSMEEDYPLGTKLKVKYGKGKNQKLYEAKVLEMEKEGPFMHYKVHYAGWNNRYDEWVKKERIVGVLSEPESKKGKHRPPPKPVKKERDSDSPRDRDDVSPAPVKKRGRPTESEKDGRDSPRGKGRLTSSVTPVKAQRPTRSTSVDTTNLSIGLPPKQRRTRRSSGVGQESMTQASDSENEASDDENTDVTDNKHESEGEDESVGGPPSSLMDDLDPDSKPKSDDIDQISDGGPDDESDEKDEDEEEPQEVQVVRKKKDRVEKVQKEEEADDENEIKPEDKLTFDTDEDDDKDFEMEDRKLEIIKSLEEDDKSVKSIDRDDSGSVSDNPSQKEEADKDQDKSKLKGKRKGKRKVSESEIVLKIEEKIPSVPPVLKPEQLVIVEDSKPDTDIKIGRIPNEPSTSEDITKKKGKVVRKDKVTPATESPSKPKLAKAEKKAPKRKVDEEDVKSDGPEETSPKKKVRRKKKDDEKPDGNASLPQTNPPSTPSKVTPKPVIVSPSKQEVEPPADVPEDPLDTTECAPQLNEPSKMDAKVSIERPAPHLSPVHVKASTSSAFKASEPPAIPEEANEASTSRASSGFALYVNTPPETPEGSVSGRSPDQGQSPSQEDTASTKSDRDAHLEVAKLMISVATAVTEAANVCDTSTLSNTSGGSSGNIPGSESEGIAQSSIKRPKEEPICAPETEKPQPPKRRKRNHKKGSDKKRTAKANLSDSDEASTAGSSSPTKSSQGGGDERQKRRTPKYNFLNMSEYQSLDPDDRIKYILGKISDLKKVYMNLKAEVACIDRRRKRHRRKERETKTEASHVSSLERIDAL